MLNLDPTTARKALRLLEQATLDHAAWHENILRAVVCGLPFDLGELADTAHRRCPLGRWYFEKSPAVLRTQPAFAAIGAEHERLHRIAARLLRDSAADMPIVHQDFEDLVAGSARLRLELDSLLRAMQATFRNQDPLTGAYGRAEMLPALREWHELANRQGQPCCIVFMDLDQFKEVNDKHGHAVGDAVLTGMVRYLDKQLRPGDKVFRYGGDEFLIALPGADLVVGQHVIKRVREGLAREPMVVGSSGLALRMTASFGLASLDPEIKVEESIERADQALLLAKTAGRNRAISWDPSVTTGTRLRRLVLVDNKS